MRDWRETLARVIDDRGLSHKELSRRIGASESYVRQIVNNKVEPTLPYFLRILEELDISFGELMYGDPLSEKQEQLLKSLSNMDEKTIDMAIEMMSVLNKSRKSD